MSFGVFCSGEVEDAVLGYYAASFGTQIRQFYAIVLSQTSESDYLQMQCHIPEWNL